MCMAITNLFVVLQQAAASQQAAVVEQATQEQSYLHLAMKGGWILLPLFILSIVAIYVIAERWMAIGRAGRKDKMWFPNTSALIREGAIQKALQACEQSVNPSAKVVATGLKEINDDIENIQELMEVEVRQQVASLERQMNYLGIIASVAPMLGFLGTIFGVIKIFYNISMTNNLDISTISDGLYQKMICSGVGLFVGIIAYSGYYLLNGKIDKVVARMDKEVNDMMRAIRYYKQNVQQ